MVVTYLDNDDTRAAWSFLCGDKQVTTMVVFFWLREVTSTPPFLLLKGSGIRENCLAMVPMLSHVNVWSHRCFQNITSD
jgi:hypothetical protein